MRVLVLSFYFRPDLSAGSFRVSALVDELIALNQGLIEVDVVTTLPNRYKSFQVDASEFETSAKLTIHRIKLPCHNSGMLDQSRAFITYLKGAIKISRDKHYALVFASSSRLMTAALGAWIARRKGCRLYLDIRDIFVDTISNFLSPKIALFAGPLFSLIERWAFNQADIINLVSGGFKDYFEDKYPNTQLSWFTNGIDEEIINAAPTSIVNTKPVPPLKILYAGNVGEGQGLHMIIPELARRLNGKVEFQIIGGGGRWEKLSKSVEEYNLRNVELCPPMPRAGLIEAYRLADILFLHLNDYPALLKVLPSKVFEYAAMGKPIVAGVSGFAAKFIDSEISNAIVFTPCDVRQAEHAIESIPTGVKPRLELLEKYSRKKIMRSMAQEISNLCSCP